VVLEQDRSASQSGGQGVYGPGKWLCCTVVVGVSVGLLFVPRSLPVVLPLLAIMGTILAFLAILRRESDGVISVFELGVIYGAIVALYGVFPLLGYLLNGMKYSRPGSAVRLMADQPSPGMVGSIAWYYVVYLLAFAVVYVLVRRKAGRLQVLVCKPSRTAVVVIVVSYLAVKLFLTSVEWYYDIADGGYMETYLARSRLPLLLRQITGHLTGATVTLEMLILIVLFLAGSRYWRLAGLWAGLRIIGAFIEVGARTGLVLFLFAAVLIYNHLVRPFKVRTVVLLGLAGLLGFLWMGMVRDLPSEMWSASPFAMSNEFESLFANAYDLNRIKASGALEPVGRAFLLSDFIALVPQQLLPFEKVIPSQWLVNTFYPDYASSGGGLAFGAISESIVGFGWIDLVCRGAAVGLVLAFVQRRYRPTFWWFAFYVWMTVTAYQSFRNTTFAPLALFVYQFLPVMVLVKVAAHLLAPSRASQPTALAAAGMRQGGES